jgi:hypothetical protein
MPHVSTVGPVRLPEVEFDWYVPLSVEFGSTGIRPTYCFCRHGHGFVELALDGVTGEICRFVYVREPSHQLVLLANEVRIPTARTAGLPRLSMPTHPEPRGSVMPHWDEPVQIRVQLGKSSISIGFGQTDAYEAIMPCPTMAFCVNTQRDLIGIVVTGIGGERMTELRHSLHRQ